MVFWPSCQRVPRVNLFALGLACDKAGYSRLLRRYVGSFNNGRGGIRGLSIFSSHASIPSSCCLMW